MKELASNLQNCEFALIPNTGHYPWLAVEHEFLTHLRFSVCSALIGSVGHKKGQSRAGVYISVSPLLVFFGLVKKAAEIFSTAFIIYY